MRQTRPPPIAKEKTTKKATTKKATPTQSKQTTPKQAANAFEDAFRRLDQYDNGDPEKAEAELRAGGAEAAAFLATKLAGRQGYRAAMVLDEMRPHAAAVADALAAELRRGDEPHRAWPARVLAAIGRLDLLEVLFSSNDRRDHFTLAEALKHGRPATYRSFDRALAQKKASLSRAIGETLEPGSGTFGLDTSDLEGFRLGLASPSAVIRRDAVCALWHVEGAPQKKRAAELLAIVFGDDDAEVRRLAVCGLDVLGKRAARAHEATWRPLAQDKNERVRKAAAALIDKLSAA